MKKSEKETIKKEIMELIWTIDNEKDFNKSFEMLLKSKNLKIKKIEAFEKIKKSNRDFPFKCIEIKVKSNKKYHISNNSMIELSIVKTFIDNMYQSFSIENIKILGGNNMNENIEKFDNVMKIVNYLSSTIRYHETCEEVANFLKRNEACKVEKINNNIYLTFFDKNLNEYYFVSDFDFFNNIEYYTMIEAI